ncbi:MAG TPA: nuclease-related domain-containing protein [Myxococcaceae bacterium]|nr:nuclease-related domain-containing protein [Myxococcaceae bacterium]
MFSWKKEAKPVPTSGRVGRRAGQSARERQEELRQAAPIKTWFTRLLAMKTDEWAWGRGAAGEEYVGALLEPLREQGWHVEHDVKIGSRGANIDHVLIGPPGVIVLNTKYVGGNVWLAGPHLHINGQPTDYVEKAEAEAKRVREKLMVATRRSALWVQAVLVFVKPTLTVKFQPRNVAVVTDEMLMPLLRQQPQKLGPYELEELVRAVRREDTWE